MGKHDRTGKTRIHRTVQKFILKIFEKLEKNA